MARRIFLSIACLVWFVATAHAQSAKVSILVDLDPNSAAQTVIVETVTADPQGRLYVCDRVTGNVIRIDPKDPKPVVVGRVAGREIQGKKVRADSSGLVFNQQGDLFIMSGAFQEILRIKKGNLDPQKPEAAETFATGRRERHWFRQKRISLRLRRPERKDLPHRSRGRTR